MKIVSRWDNSKVLWEGECNNIREELEAAVKAGACLESANLAGADLSGAYLARAYLAGAYLARADLAGADLSGTNLAGADLARAYLESAYLARADLSGAYLAGAYLAGAYLESADLARADLSGADLAGADLAGAKGLNPNRVCGLRILLEQSGPIRAYKLVTAEGIGPYNGGITYQVGQSYEVANANTDEAELCGAGINLATLDWCMREWEPGYRILVVEFTAADIAAIPTATDGKFRVHRCTVVGEKDLVAIGLVDA